MKILHYLQMDMFNRLQGWITLEGIKVSIKHVMSVIKPFAMAKFAIAN